MKLSTGKLWLALATAVTLVTVVASGACARAERRTGAADGLAAPVRLAVAGTVNANASIASRGDRVVVAWAATADAVTNIYAVTSGDGGATFGAPVRVNDMAGDARVSGEQAPRVTVDAGDRVSVVWTSRLDGKARLRVSQSSDAGATFSPAATLHSEDVNGSRGWASVTTDAAGVMHAAWLDSRANAPAGGHQHAQASSTAGTTKPHAMKQGLFHAIWRPGEPSTDTPVASDVCFCCKTSITTHGSATVFVAWRHIYPVNMRDMAVARSDDGGQSFTAPTRVSEDGWQIDACPEDGPSIAASSDGVLHIAWPTMVDAAKTRKAVFYSQSLDRGATFSLRTRVDADSAAARASSRPQLTVAGDRVFVIWDETTADSRIVYVRNVATRHADGRWIPANMPAVALTTGDPAFYPALASLPSGIVAAWTVTTPTGSDISVRRITSTDR